MTIMDVTSYYVTFVYSSNREIKLCLDLDPNVGLITCGKLAQAYHISCGWNLCVCDHISFAGEPLLRNIFTFLTLICYSLLFMWYILMWFM